MKKINFLDCPCEIFGLYGYKKGEEIKRMPQSLVKLLPEYMLELATHPTGSRVCFKTNADTIKINLKLKNVYVDRGMSYYQANVGAVYVGERINSVFYGLLSAEKSYDENEVYGEFSLPQGTNEIVVYLPRNPQVIDINFEIDDDAQIFAPSPYTFSGGKPILFYGSSITENGHTASQNAYTAVLSRWLDADFYNFGFSGSAKGETAMAQYLSLIDAGIFIYDYDHNAPSAEHLEKTHKSFFEIYRKKNPLTPVIMMSKPYDDMPETLERREIIYKNYLDAKNNGDNNVYFIDGLSYFPEDVRQICTTDRTHPNCLGHYFMAKKLKEVIDKIAAV